MINLEKILKARIEKLDNQIRRAAEERDEASTPNESNHKLTRQISDQLFNSLTDERRLLVLLTPKIRHYKNVYKVEKIGSNVSTNYFVVPDGLGGELFEDTLLVGETSPIGMILATKNGGEEFIFNKTSYVVVDVFENN